MASQSNAALPPGLEVSGYRIIKKIASGGFSIVYLARDTEGETVVIKEYLPSSILLRRDGEYVPSITPENLKVFRIGLKCFFEEGRSLANISHPNVVRVLNFFRANDTVYMVMEYASGRSLLDVIVKHREKQRPFVLNESAILRIFTKVMDGLREVHTNKLLHLDIKPANIYLRIDRSPILLDFGAARQVLTEEKPSLLPMFTPGFAAPELQKRDTGYIGLGPWTDIYSIGATIYACMSGAPPQPAAERLTSDKLPEEFKKLRSAYSDTLTNLVEWCMTLNPLDRPQSVFSLQKAMAKTPTAERSKLATKNNFSLKEFFRPIIKK